MTQSTTRSIHAAKYTALAAALAVAPLAAPLAAEQTAGDRAVITIPTPRSANLLQLRGIGGRGTALLQVDGECYGMPVRLVAGDFAGLQAGVPRNTPIVLHIRDPHIVNALLNGTDIVSDGSEVANYPAKRSAGILIQSGLTAETGFVINPGSNLLADIFGVHASQTPCDEMDAAQPAGPEG